MTVITPPGFDWKDPDYTAVFQQRIAALARIREAAPKDPQLVPGLKAFYKDNPVQYIVDWGITTDPRNVDVDRPTLMPFIPFPRQVEWLEWVLESWRLRRPGATAKSRDSGVSWLAIALSCTLCMFHDGMTVGFGSRKLELVDKLGDPDALFWKAREFMTYQPHEFTGGWSAKADAPEKLIRFPRTGSVIKGEGGDDIGRGGRSTLYFVDESASLVHPELADAALQATTNCRQDISTPKGIGGSFYQKVMEWPEERVFRFHWRDDPRKDDAWYQKMLSEHDEVVIAQEVDMDFAASVAGVVIPGKWVQMAVDAHIRLGVTVTGARTGAFDIADEGRDNCAFAVAKGVLIEHVEEWSGKGSDTFLSTQRAFDIADTYDLEAFKYDADGMGAGVRGDANVINRLREERRQRTHRVFAFRGSGDIHQPRGQDEKGRYNEDYFRNRKAQSWFALRRRFYKTYRAIEYGDPFDPYEIISISSAIPPKVRSKLLAELSQPVYRQLETGHMIVDKAPDLKTNEQARKSTIRSPNLADSVMMVYGPADRPPMVVSAKALEGI